MEPLYSSYTYGHPNFLVRYPHRRRIEILNDNIAKLNPNSWLDYGAGDGAIYKFLRNSGTIEQAAVVLYEPWNEIRNQMGLKSTERCRIVEHLDETPRTSFDLITALEVLEHLPLPERLKFYSFVALHLTEAGRCIIEVPIEFGPILLLKEWGRRVLKGRTSDYRLTEMLWASAYGAIEDVNDRYDPADSRTFITPHHGFDSRRLLKELSLIGNARIIAASPFAFLPQGLNQCVIIDFQPTVRNPGEITRRLLNGH